MLWHLPVVSALGQQRQADLCVEGQPGIHKVKSRSAGTT